MVVAQEKKRRSLQPHLWWSLRPLPCSVLWRRKSPNACPWYTLWSKRDVHVALIPRRVLLTVWIHSTLWIIQATRKRSLSEASITTPSWRAQTSSPARWQSAIIQPWHIPYELLRRAITLQNRFSCLEILKRRRINIIEKNARNYCIA